MLKEIPNTVPPNSANHHGRFSFSAPASIVMPAVNTAVNPNIPKIGLGMWSKALACGLAITGEQATIGLKLQLVTRCGSLSSSIFSIVKIDAAPRPMLASASKETPNIFKWSNLAFLTSQASDINNRPASAKNHRTSERVIKTAKNKNMIGSTGIKLRFVILISTIIVYKVIIAQIMK